MQYAAQSTIKLPRVSLKINTWHDPIPKLFVRRLTLSISFLRDRSLGRRCLWAGAGSDRFAVQCGLAPPQSADKPDDSPLGWDGTLAEAVCVPGKEGTADKPVLSFKWVFLEEGAGDYLSVLNSSYQFKFHLTLQCPCASVNTSKMDIWQ